MACHDTNATRAFLVGTNQGASTSPEGSPRRGYGLSKALELVRRVLFVAGAGEVVRVEHEERCGLARVIDTGEHDNHLRINPLELVVFKPPENILDPVGSPAEVGRVPAKEVRFSVFEEWSELRVGSAPAPCD